MSEPTKMPSWLQYEIKCAEQRTSQWSDGERRAAGIPTRSDQPKQATSAPSKAQDSETTNK